MCGCTCYFCATLCCASLWESLCITLHRICCCVSVCVVSLCGTCVCNTVCHSVLRPCILHQGICPLWGASSFPAKKHARCVVFVWLWMTLSGVLGGLVAALVWAVSVGHIWCFMWQVVIWERLLVLGNGSVCCVALFMYGCKCVVFVQPRTLEYSMYGCRT